MSLPQRRKALYRVEHSGDAPRWFHYSQKNDAVVLRSLRQAKPNNDIEWEQQRYRLPEDLARLNSELSGAKEFPLPSGLSIEHPNKWLEVFESLDSAVDTIPVTKGRNEPEVDPAIGATQTDRIPQTRWRRLYQTLRDFGTLGLQKQMVEDLVNTRSSKKLQYIFSDSVSHFSRRYKDTRAFRGGQSASLQGYRDATEQFARCVAARLECGAVQVIPGPSLPTVPHRQLEFVDYEISPFRTPGGAEFEDGTSGRGSGAGGVDLILVDDAGALVIGEIKAPRDSTTFLAFVQALTYAAELTTRSQAERLRRWYPKLANLTLGEDGCQCDIVLIYKDGDAPQLLDQTRALASLLVVPGTAIGRKVRRVDFVKASLSEGGGLHLECVDSVG